MRGAWDAALEILKSAAVVLEAGLTSSERLDAGNPVFSVVQPDIIRCGHDLRACLAHEFVRSPYHGAFSPEPRRIRFRSELANAP